VENCLPGWKKWFRVTIDQENSPLRYFEPQPSFLGHVLHIRPSGVWTRIKKKYQKIKKAWSDFRSRNWLARETSELLLIQSKDKPSNVLNLLTCTGVRGDVVKRALLGLLASERGLGMGMGMETEHGVIYLSTCLACLVELSLAVVHSVNIIA
jgi:hypothetical protein